MNRDDLEQVVELVAGTFAQGADAAAMRADLRRGYVECPLLPPEHTYVALEGGRVVACGQGLVLRLRLGRAEVPVAGIQALAAAPSMQGRGVTEALLARALEAAREQGIALLFGFARKGGLFVRGGGASISGEPSWQVDAWRLPTPRGPSPFRDAGPDDEERIAAWHAQDGLERGLGLVRPAALRPWLPRRATLLRVHARGHLGVRLAPDALEVREACGEDAGFQRDALLELGELARRAGLRLVRGHVPPDHPLVAASLPCGATTTVSYSAHAGAMGRVLDLGLLLLQARPELEARLAGSSPGPLELVVHPGDGPPARVTLGEGPAARRLELPLAPGALLQALVGHRPAPELLAERVERGADADGAAAALLADPAALRLLGALFPRRHPFVWHTDRF